MWQKNAKEDEIWKEMAENDIEMVCDGGFSETNEPNCI